ncbi:hypothetical protein PFNF135_06177 [Plasmodium falciparum NF135/5.C10]|uniref:Plasmodium falciparum erythrocyte membrane protein-1 N-terminal segment domain-containing protein n=1 Tax=Plasmodium falciparum NF135/5.C10 TaxID=1036726 RepID=W4I8S5_PLAFA|nr:hypothetical protein PFNF135_06177 [Plasmodium falciparum NF135/5.C10]
MVELAKMGPPGITGTEDPSAKHMFDRIGQQVYDKVKNGDAKNYIDDLKGNLASSSIWKESASTTDPCGLDYSKLISGSGGGGAANSERHPCKNLKGITNEERFSNTLGGQCTDSKMRSGGIGACAPYRRLHLCHHNLETINNTTSMTTHKLLAEVCMAAKYEGASITRYHPQHKKTNPDSQLCTVLARSFADIGDIVRGRDLFYGNPQEKEKRDELETNFKKIFKEIYDDVTRTATSGKKGQKSAEAEKRYKGDTTDYFQLREDWWTANRQQVWKAITCGAGAADEYFRKSRDGVILYFDGHCGRDETDVPTNLDYVPQFLRWFDEWSEDFCRLKKIKFKLAKDACHDYSKNLYCSLNGFDCKKYNPNKDASSRDTDCTSCSNKCLHYEFWLRNQRKEFQKQKTKYTKEIEKYKSSSDKSNSNINNKYHKEFYENFEKNNYESVENFLTLLNKGMYCKKENTEDAIDFTNNVKKTFDRSKYCQPCPDCIVVCERGNCTEKKGDDKCRKKYTYIIPAGMESTKIDILFSGENQEDITEKLRSFCKNTNNENGENIEKWECYYKNEYDNKCKMTSLKREDQKHHDLMSYYEFFDFWVTHLIKDTIKWESDINDCINNTNVTNCNNGCNENCICFEKWVGQKQKEWENVKKVLKNPSENLNNYYNKLNGIFSGFFFGVMHELKKKEAKQGVKVEKAEKSEEAQEAQEEEAKWNKLTAKLEEIIKSHKENTGTGNTQDAIEPLLKYLDENALTCKDNNSLKEDKNCPKTKKNPCIKRTRKRTLGASNNLVSVKHIAEMMQRRAREQLEEGGVGEIKLKGDASQGEYSRTGRAKGSQVDHVQEKIQAGKKKHTP